MSIHIHALDAYRPRASLIHRLDARVKLALALDRQELEQALQGLGPAMMASSGAGKVDVRPRVSGSGQWSWGKPVQQARRQTPPKKRVIRIYGLEEGVREIPFSQ